MLIVTFNSGSGTQPTSRHAASGCRAVQDDARMRF